MWVLSHLLGGIEEPPMFEMNYSKLTEKKIAAKIRGLGSLFPLGMEEDDFRLSIAGAQEKLLF